MKIVIISGSHPRHLYFVNGLIQTGFVCGMVIQKREEMIMDIPLELSGHMRGLYKHHFKLRLEMEEKYFSQVEAEHILNEIPYLEVPEEKLNSRQVEEFIRSLHADLIISYGPGLLKDNILNAVGGNAFNLHGGLSHWYKGAATMFWPFYFLEPNYVGTTLHYINNRIDAGNIVHHTVPKLERGDCMHEVACKAIVAATDDVTKIIRLMGAGQRFLGVPQKKNGKLFLERDWRPEHLNLIYDTFDDKIVDLYLDGEISKNNTPKLVQAF